MVHTDSVRTTMFVRRASSFVGERVLIRESASARTFCCFGTLRSVECANFLGGVRVFLEDGEYVATQGIRTIGPRSMRDKPALLTLSLAHVSIEKGESAERAWGDIIARLPALKRSSSVGEGLNRGAREGYASDAEEDYKPSEEAYAPATPYAIAP